MLKSNFIVTKFSSSDYIAMTETFRETSAALESESTENPICFVISSSRDKACENKSLKFLITYLCKISKRFKFILIDLPRNLSG